MNRLVTLIMILGSLVAAPRVEAQVRNTVWSSAPTVSLSHTISSATSTSRPWIRTAAAIAGSAAGFAVAHSRVDDPDDLLLPIAAGAATGAAGALIFSNAHPLKVLAGSALATLPAGAFAVYFAKVTDDGDQGDIPLVVFSIPHGLLTSAFAQDRPR